MGDLLFVVAVVDQSSGLVAWKAYVKEGVHGEPRQHATGEFVLRQATWDGKVVATRRRICAVLACDDDVVAVVRGGSHG